MKVEIHLEPGETKEEAEELLFKALHHHRAGEEHRHAFHQPGARDVFNRILKRHDEMWKRMMKQIEEVIDDDVSRP